MDQVVEQKMDFIQSKVEEILYQYVGISKPVKKEKNPDEALEVETDLLPTDLEQVSPDSDKKSSTSEIINAEDIKDEEIEEEIVEDDDFESPAFEPVEAMEVDRNEQSQHSNLSAISGLTSQDSVENKIESNSIEPQPTEIQEQLQQDTQLSQISSIQDMSQEAETVPAAVPIIEEETPMDAAVIEQKEALSAAPEKSQFDLKKDSIEFTGTERKCTPLDDSTNSVETEKALQPQDVPRNTTEIENLYENDTTDSSEMRMEIDLKDETTQETADSSKIEESSQDSTVSKEKRRSDHKKDSHHHHHKSDRSRDKHKSSSHKSSHHHRSSSSRHDDKNKGRSDGKSRSSSSHKKGSIEKDRSSSSRRDHDRDKKSSKDDSSRSKHREHKKTDDHHHEKSSSRRRRSTDHDSNDGKSRHDKSASKPSADVGLASEPSKNSQSVEKIPETSSPKNIQEAIEKKPTIVDKMVNENSEISMESSSTSSSTKKEQKSSILVKYDYLKSNSKAVEAKRASEKSEDGFLGFTEEEREETANPWFECMRKEEAQQKKKVVRPRSNNNYLEQRKLNRMLNLEGGKSKSKAKSKTPETTGEPSTDLKVLNGNETITAESRAQSIAQQQRYTDDDLYKPRVDFGGNRNRRRRGNSETNSNEVKEVKVPEVPTEINNTAK